jgi:acyl-ACP thioesterase
MMNQMFLGYAFPGNVLLKKASVAQFRLWPIDIDLFGHMNNASYIRVAELSRW